MMHTYTHTPHLLSVSFRKEGQNWWNKQLVFFFEGKKCPKVVKWQETKAVRWYRFVISHTVLLRKTGKDEREMRLRILMKGNLLLEWRLQEVKMSSREERALHSIVKNTPDPLGSSLSTHKSLKDSMLDAWEKRQSPWRQAGDQPSSRRAWGGVKATCLSLGNSWFPDISLERKMLWILAGSPHLLPHL